MNKTDLIDEVTKSIPDAKKVAVTKVVDNVILTIIESLKSGNVVKLPGFGTFDVQQRGARKGRNPRTGAAVTVEARKVAKFKPGKRLRDGINS